jgi:phosphate transport system substrate-binding protein
MVAVTASGDGVRGKVHIDGSSTVYPITEAVAEEYRPHRPQVRVTVGISGTAGGFERFCVGETDVNDASRPIKVAEIKLAEKHGIDFIELPIAFDGISVIVSANNDFVHALTTTELHRIWQPASQVTTWRDVRADWPDAEIRLYAPGVDSGTFDYFTKAINGHAMACRTDFTASEDDNMLVLAVASDVNALGFLGHSYVHGNQDVLRAVAVDDGQGPVTPSRDTISTGSYQPLSRPMFIYVNAAAAGRREVADFVRFYLDHAPQLAREVGYAPLTAGFYERVRQRFERGQTGSLFHGNGSTIGVTFESLATTDL